MRSVDYTTVHRDGDLHTALIATATELIGDGSVRRFSMAEQAAGRKVGRHEVCTRTSLTAMRY